MYGRDAFTAIEVRNRRTVTGDLGGLRAFGEDYPSARRVVVYRGERRLLVGGVPCWPLHEFLAGVTPGRDLSG